MLKLRKVKNIITLMILVTLLLSGWSITAQASSKKDLQIVYLSVERTGNLLTGIGKVTVYIDGKKVMKVKNNQTESVDLLLSKGTHKIQTKGQGDKSKVLKFKVEKGKDNSFRYHTEISNIYGVKLNQVK